MNQNGRRPVLWIYSQERKIRLCEIAGIAKVSLLPGREHPMTIREINPPQIDLNRRPGARPLMVDMQSFFEFSFWMAEELLDLEAQYLQNAAAMGPQRFENFESA